MVTGDLAWTTDLKTLYRYSGAAWTAIGTYSGAGLLAARLAATNLPDGSTYYSTDTATMSVVESAAWVNVPASVGLELTIAIWRTFTATGEDGFVMAPTNINDNNSSTCVYVTPANLGKYCEVIFDAVYWIRRYNMYGHAGQTTHDGRYKFMIYNLTTHAWEDWVLAIPTWPDWYGEVTVTPVLTDRIRVYFLTADCEGANLYIGELTLRY